VGDRHVLEAMQAGQLSLGGEQSGHIVFADHGTTGDGTFTGVALAELVARSGRTLADLASASMVRLPQVLRNVTVADRAGLATPGRSGTPWRTWRRRSAAPAGFLLRPSGTEPLVRVMVEAPTEAGASEAA
jgi:phosphoglucosamine mutase